LFEFHITRQARQKYQFDETLFATMAAWFFSILAQRAVFAERIYAVERPPHPASDIYALGLMDEILHLIIRQYEKQNRVS